MTMAENDVENIPVYKSKYSGEVIDSAITDWLAGNDKYLFTSNIVYEDVPRTIKIPVLENTNTISTKFLPLASTDTAGTVIIGAGLYFDSSTGKINVNEDLRDFSARLNSKVEATDLYNKYIKFKTINNSTNTYVMVIDKKQNTFVE